MPAIHLRDLKPGARFVLLRTMDKYTYLGLGPAPHAGLTRRLVRREFGDCDVSTLHHSCHVKPLVRVVTAPCSNGHLPPL